MIEAPNAVITNNEKTAADINFIESCIRQHFLVTTLDSQMRSLIVNKMTLYTVEANEVIFAQNEPGANFYVIITGSLEILINARRKENILARGHTFGELALIHNSPRSATIRTKTK